MVAEQIDEAVDDRDPVLSNLRITLVHQQLSLALRQLIGQSSGANFHTWAVWGSRTAGRTIRHEDLPVPMRVVTPAATLGGAGAAAVMRARRGPGQSAQPRDLARRWCMRRWRRRTWGRTARRPCGSEHLRRECDRA